uniref:Uncharacterized protein n=1 Tax=Anabas testudineus TaxID=64144 RepID=A0A3Q1J535_ANATE
RKPTNPLKREAETRESNPKPFKLQSAPHPSKKDSENQDPRVSEIGKKTSLRPGVSRLPVLAKSLHLQTPSDFSQSHCRWEEKPLAGKAKKNKPCTRPVPFNLSQPKSSRTTNENQQPLQSQTGSNAVQPENNISNARLKAQSINTKPSKHLAVESSTGVSTRGTLKSHGKNTDNTIHASGQSGPRNTSKPSTPLSNPHLSSIRSGKSVQFSPDAVSLQSILQNEGVKAAGPVGATPKNSACPSGRGTSIYTAQRVPVRKNRLQDCCSVAVKDTPLNKWTPQRVQDTRHQPMSAMITTHCEENVETSKASTSEDEEKEQTFERRQPFIQAPERESVIFFSTGKKLSFEHFLALQLLHFNFTDVILQKTCAMSPAVALLRKRLPPLEELRMDEEVATYTSVSVSDAHGFLPPRPRCGNPLATILHLEESTTFVPIGFDLSSGPSSGPSSPLSSTLQER